MSNKGWQNNMKDVIGNKKLNNIIIPGTHDSGAYQFIYHKVFSGKMSTVQKAFNILRIVAALIPPVYIILRDWTLTQDKTILQQANLGVRSFDLRILWSQEQNRWYIGHTMPVAKYEDIINDVVKFLKQPESKNEFIILQIKKDYENRNTVTKEKVDDFWKFNKSKKEFYDKVWLKQTIPTYNELIESGKRIILIIKSDLRSNNKNLNTDKLFYLGNHHNEKWANTNDKNVSVEKQITFLKNIKKKSLSNNKFISVLGTTTAKISNILKGTECITILSFGIIFTLIIIILLKLSYIYRFDNTPGYKNLIAKIVLGILNIILIILFFKRNCYSRMKSIYHDAIPLQTMFIKMLNKNKDFVNHMSILTFDFPKKESIDFTINLNNYKIPVMSNTSPIKV